MPTNDVYTFGYGNRSLKTFQEVVASLDAIVVDVRISPHSKRPDWDMGSLAQTFSCRYVWIGQWGNAGKCEGVIRLLDFDRGLRLFERIQGHPCILLCACRSRIGCHRDTIARLLKERGYTVRELAWPKRVKKVKEPKNLRLTP